MPVLAKYIYILDSALYPVRATTLETLLVCLYHLLLVRSRKHLTARRETIIALTPPASAHSMSLQIVTTVTSPRFIAAGHPEKDPMRPLKHSCSAWAPTSICLTSPPACYDLFKRVTAVGVKVVSSKGLQVGNTAESHRLTPVHDCFALRILSPSVFRMRVLLWLTTCVWAMQHCFDLIPNISVSLDVS